MYIVPPLEATYIYMYYVYIVDQLHVLIYTHSLIIIHFIPFSPSLSSPPLSLPPPSSHSPVHCRPELERGDCQVHTSEPQWQPQRLRMSGGEGLLPLLAPHPMEGRSPLVM